jgi:hypothetical protein
MIATHDSALEDRPESFDGVRVNRAIDVLAARMIDGLMPIAALRVTDAERVIDLLLIGAEQTNFARDSFADESKQFFGVRWS